MRNGEAIIRRNRLQDGGRWMQHLIRAHIQERSAERDDHAGGERGEDLQKVRHDYHGAIPNIGENAYLGMCVSWRTVKIRLFA